MHVCTTAKIQKLQMQQRCGSGGGFGAAARRGGGGGREGKPAGESSKRCFCRLCVCQVELLQGSAGLGVSAGRAGEAGRDRAGEGAGAGVLSVRLSGR